MATPTGKTTIAVEVEARVKITDTVGIFIQNPNGFAHNPPLTTRAVIHRKHVAALILEPEELADGGRQAIPEYVSVHMANGLVLKLVPGVDLGAANELIFGGEVDEA